MKWEEDEMDVFMPIGMLGVMLLLAVYYYATI
jgi:hypothetical protein